MNKPTLTIPSTTHLERAVLRALYSSAAGNGHDFGLIEDARNDVRADQLGGVISSLVKKHIIRVHDEVSTDSGTWTQFTWVSDEIRDDVRALLGLGQPKEAARG